MVSGYGMLGKMCVVARGEKVEEGHRLGKGRSTYRMQEQLLQLGCSHMESQNLLGKRLQGRHQWHTCLIPGCSEFR